MGGVETGRVGRRREEGGGEGKEEGEEMVRGPVLDKKLKLLPTARKLATQSKVIWSSLQTEKLEVLRITS